MVRYVLLRPLRPELDGQDVEVLILLVVLLALDGLFIDHLVLVPIILRVY
jgi:hypothetical protein